MKPLEIHLEKMGHECISINLKLTYREFVDAVMDLETLVMKLNLMAGEKINLVGHSTGGLVIRKFLSDSKYNHLIGKCVLIATPNKGSRLADFASNIKGYTKIYRTLKSLTSQYLANINFTNDANIEMGVIAGNKNNLLLGKLLKGESDGRVELNSAYFLQATDFITFSYGHKEIHHKIGTAKAVDAFLKYGKFSKEVRESLVD